MQPEFYIFLDFDGVLHTYGCGKEGLFSRMPVFADFLRRNPFILVVVSSTWRKSDDFNVVMPAARLRKYFPDDVRSRVIGCTPALPRLTKEWDEPVRQREVLAWLEKKNKLNVPYIVIDDDDSVFEKSFNPLFLCDPEVGLDEEYCLKLQARVDAIIHNP